MTAGRRVMLVVRAEGDDAGWTDRRRTTPVDVHVFVVQVHVDDDRRRRRRRTRRLPDDVQAHHSDVVRRPVVVVRLDELAALLGCSTTVSSPVSDQPRRGGPRAAVADSSGPARCASAAAVSQSVGRSVRVRPYCSARRALPPHRFTDVSLSLSFSVSRMPCFLNTHSACSAYITLYKYYLIVYK